MAIVLIPAAWIAVTVLLGVRFAAWGLRLAAMRAAVLIAAYCVLSTELLSLFRGVTRTSLIIIWLIPLAVSGYLICRLQRKGFSLRDLLSGAMPSSWPMRLMLLGLLIILFLTALVAWLSPPNTWDSLNTHMSRVAHWAQEGGVVPYATGIEKQNYYPPFPGIAILQTYVLTQGDRWANFVQWSAMLLSLIGVSYIAKMLGAGPLGQTSAAVFAASLPMGIIQATSTMTDYLVALWVVIIAAEICSFKLRQEWRETAIFISLAAGLAANTKPTSFAYLLPFALYSGYLFLKVAGWKRSLLALLLCTALLGVINAGYLGRNLRLYGGLIGPQAGIDIHTNEILNWRVLVSNTLRNASLHAGSSIPKLNSLIYAGLYKVHQWINLELTDPRTSIHESFAVHGPSMDEKKAGNFLHAVLILLVVLLLLSMKRKVGDARILAALMVSAFLISSLMFKFTIFGSRYHVAFFVLFAPVVGRAMDAYLRDTAQMAVAVILVISSWSWLIGIGQRPLLPKKPGADSLLTSPRATMYFPEGPGHAHIYSSISREILDRECRNVGIAIGGAAAEYPFWVYLGAPRSNMRIEWIIGDRAPSANFRDADFEPCALICDSTCPEEWDTFRGMPIILESAGYRLYMEDFN